MIKKKETFFTDCSSDVTEIIYELMNDECNDDEFIDNCSEIDG